MNPPRIREQDLGGVSFRRRNRTVGVQEESGAKRERKSVCEFSILEVVCDFSKGCLGGMTRAEAQMGLVEELTERQGNAGGDGGCRQLSKKLEGLASWSWGEAAVFKRNFWCLKVD